MRPASPSRRGSGPTLSQAGAAGIMTVVTTAVATTYRAKPARGLSALLRRWALWQERSRQRQRLAQLDDHLLKDIGLRPDQAAREASKPFWRA